MAAPRPDSCRLSLDDLGCLMRGASVLGTGGGGSFAVGRLRLQALGATRPLLVPLEALAALGPDALGVTVGMLGGGLTGAEVARMEAGQAEPLALRAARALERVLGRRLDFVYAAELGPQNTLEALALGAMLDLPVPDGDCAGRAVPELGQTTLELGRVAPVPFVLASFQGDLLVVAEAGPDRAEQLCRAMAVASGGLVCFVGYPLDGRRAQEVLIRGSLSHCLAMGREIGPGRWPGAALASLGGGRVAFRGRVAAFEVAGGDGFFRGHLGLDGTGPFAGSRYRVGIQNEFMWAWRDGVLDIRCPELICVVDSASGLGKVTYGNGFENAVAMGEDLTVLQLPAAEVWRSDAGRRRFPPPPLPPEEPG